MVFIFLSVNDTILYFSCFFFSLEKSTQLSSLEREELLNQIDFSRVNEETIVACRTNKLIPQQMITDAALSLCSQLRAQLDDTLGRLRLIETQLARTRTTYTTSSSSKMLILREIHHLVFFLLRLSISYIGFIVSSSPSNTI